MDNHNNPYRAPKADVELSGQTPDIEPKTLKDIRCAWIAAVVSGSITLLASLAGMVLGDGVLGFSAWTLLDAALIFGLAFGIYRKNRVCAVIMLVYFIGSKILMLMEGYGSNAMAIGLGLLFLFFYTRGVIGTFSYHRQIKAPQYLTQG